MPIYEYYCPACHGRFSHLAKRMGEPAPACPRCNYKGVERLMSAASVLHGQAHHDASLKEQRAEINEDDAQDVAQFLKASGRLKDADGLYASRAYRELLHRRAEGATDDDLADLVDDLSAEMKQALEESDAGVTAGAALFSQDMEARMQADQAPAHEHEHDEEEQTRRSADDLGWA